MKKEKNLVRVEHVWSVAAVNVSVDEATKNVSLFNVLEQLNLNRKEINSRRESEDKPISVAFPFKLVTFLRRIGEGSFAGDLKVEVVGPKNEALGTAENPVKFQEDRDRLRIVIEFPGINITGAGYYLLKVSIRHQKGEYEEISKVPIQVGLK